MRAKAAIYLNRDKIRSDDTCPISIRVTWRRQRRYYPLGVHMKPEEFSNPKGRARRDAKYCDDQLHRATSIINDLAESFSFDRFATRFARGNASQTSLEAAFTAYIEKLEGDRVGSIAAYLCTLRSLMSFRKNPDLRDIDPVWLREYERWMDKNGRSKTTIGIYCRHLRAVMNEAVAEGLIPREVYPFGRRKYEIPTSANKKKALVPAELKKIFEYSPPPGSTAERMHAYWMFLYLCNGINVADFARLKKTDLSGTELTFVREKTKRTKRRVEPIVIQLLPRAADIIRQFGADKKDPYLFPVLSPSMPPKVVDDAINNLTRLINKHMDRIGQELGVPDKITTYTARHSFATILKNSGAPVALISQMLGHSSILTTQNYLASFESDQVKKATQALMDF